MAIETAVKPTTTANGTKPAWEGGKWPDESIVKLNLWQRLLLAQTSAKGLAKHGTAPQIMGGFHFATDADVADAAREFLSAFGIVYIPSLPELVNLDAGVTSTNKPIYRTDVRVTLTLKNADRPEETEVVTWHGRGDDTGDKGVGKAGTSAVKNAFIKLLNLQGDPSQDPDGADATRGEDRAPRTTTRPERAWQAVTPPSQGEHSGIDCTMAGCAGTLVQRNGSRGAFVSCTMYKSCGLKPIDGTLEDYVAHEEEVEVDRVIAAIPAPTEPAPEPQEELTGLSDFDYILRVWRKPYSDARKEAFDTGGLIQCLIPNSKGAWVLKDEGIEILRRAPAAQVKAVADCFRLRLTP